MHIQEKLKNMEILFDQEDVLVIDNGTGFIKAGFSGQDLPRIITPTVVGSYLPPADPTMAASGVDDESSRRQWAFGNAALKSKDTHDIVQPISRGVIVDREHMHQMWTHVFDELNVDFKSCNVLLTDSPFSTKQSRMETTQFMFETLGVKSLAIMNTAVLSMYSSGRTSGLVAEVGEGTSYTVPVFQGYALPHAQIKMDLAGQDVTQRLIDSLEELGKKVSNHAETIRGLKEQMCSIAQHYDSEIHSLDDPLDSNQRSYELPGGEIIEVNHKTRFNATEVLFQPALMGVPSLGIAEMAYKSIELCDNDLKNSCLYNSIMLAGGSTMMPGFKERFENDIRMLAAQSADCDIKVFADLHRKNASWIGGSMISSFSTFRDMAVSKEEYEAGESGDKPLAILKKSVN